MIPLPLRFTVWIDGRPALTLAAPTPAEAMAALLDEFPGCAIVLQADPEEAPHADDPPVH